MTNPFLKDPSDVIDFTVDYTSWLDDDTITGTPTWSVQTGLTTVSTSNTTKLAVIWLSGGVNKTDYLVTCQIVTAGGRTKQQSFIVQVRDNIA